MIGPCRKREKDLVLVFSEHAPPFYGKGAMEKREKRALMRCSLFALSGGNNV